LKKIKYAITGGLDQDDLKAIHRKALQLIQEIGIAIPHEPTLKLLKGHKGVRIEGNKAYYDSDLVESLTQDVKGYPHYDYRHIAGGYAHNFLDPFTRELRPPKLADLVFSARLADALDLDVIAQVVPLDIPSENIEIAMFKAIHENCRKSYGGGQITTIKTAEAVAKMAELLGTPFSLEMWVISPLVMDATQLGIIHHFRDRGPDIWLANMPLKGVSTPIFTGAAFIQSVAECLAGAATLRMASPKSRIFYRSDAFFLYPFDMQRATALWCSPQYTQYILIQNQIARFYGVKPMGKSMLTMAREPNAQACFEKGLNTAIVALCGSENFAAAGVLGGVDIFSPEQMFLDKEIFELVMYSIQDQEFDLDNDCFDIIREVGQGGSFLGHDTTLDNFRSEIIPTRYFNKDYKCLRDLLREDIQKTQINEKGVLSRSVQKELDGICEYFYKIKI
jgi:trimethylamine:corrinoid methyltransferase-like protein